jgi:hypothetical protein
LGYLSWQDKKGNLPPGNPRQTKPHRMAVLHGAFTMLGYSQIQTLKEEKLNKLMWQSSFARSTTVSIAIGVLVSLVAMSATANPCGGIDRSLTEARKVKLAPAIAKEEKVEKVEVLRSFRSRNWYIIYINNYISDEPFLFYSSNPMTTKPISSWSGAATINEEQEMKVWTIKNVPGIPKKLASCFAWHVTLERAQ